MKIVFASNNLHKVKEIQEIVPDDIEIVSLADIGCDEDIPETADTLEGNALQKAQYVQERYGFSCFADDTGLEVEALEMAPGPFSARYAGPQRSSADNIHKLLTVMDKINNRKARFRTVIALIIDGKATQFEGIVDGEILRNPVGNDGFGYDPIFRPEGFEQSFAQMALDAKNKISHRGRAVAKLVDYLEKMNH